LPRQLSTRKFRGDPSKTKMTSTMVEVADLTNAERCNCCLEAGVTMRQPPGRPGFHCGGGNGARFRATEATSEKLMPPRSNKPCGDPSKTKMMTATLEVADLTNAEQCNVCFEASVTMRQPPGQPGLHCGGGNDARFRATEAASEQLMPLRCNKPRGDQSKASRAPPPWLGGGPRHPA
jgi:hypothetical protein